MCTTGRRVRGLRGRRRGRTGSEPKRVPGTLTRSGRLDTPRHLSEAGTRSCGTGQICLNSRGRSPWRSGVSSRGEVSVMKGTSTPTKPPVLAHV